MEAQGNVNKAKGFKFEVRLVISLVLSILVCATPIGGFIFWAVASISLISLGGNVFISLMETFIGTWVVIHFVVWVLIPPWLEKRRIS